VDGGSPLSLANNPFKVEPDDTLRKSHGGSDPMNDYQFTAISLALSLITIIVGLYFHADPWTTVVVILLQDNLMFTLRLFSHVKGNDPYFGSTE
jgi:hypothetical protein